MARPPSPVTDAGAGAVVLVTYNSARHIGVALQALGAYAPTSRAIVVDNGSADGTLDVVRGSHPEACVVVPGRNLGFAGGCNAGARAMPDADWYLFLNPDVVVGPGSVDAMLRTLRERGAGATGARLHDEAGAYQHGFAVRAFPSAAYLALDLLLLNRLWPGNPVLRAVRNDRFDPERTQPVEQPAGAALMVDGPLFRALGGFDERFHPLWFEDVDLCRRIRSAGREIWFVADARMAHVGGHSVASLDAASAKAYWYANLMRYARKHFSPATAAMLRVCTVIGALLRGALALASEGVGGAARQLVVAWRAATRGDVALWYR